jgi:xanthine dehydrogenase YagS FAD-binding subunit
VKSFSYLSAPDVGTALRTIADGDDVKFLAGGTNLVDLMREGIEHPATVVDITLSTNGRRPWRRRRR